MRRVTCENVAFLECGPSPCRGPSPLSRTSDCGDLGRLHDLLEDYGLGWTCSGDLPQNVLVDRAGLGQLRLEEISLPSIVEVHTC